jgi:hypothetical protein
MVLETATSRMTNPLIPHILTGGVNYATISLPTGSKILCEHCTRTAVDLIGDLLSITHRHDGKWHRTIVNLKDFGFEHVKSD